MSVCLSLSGQSSQSQTMRQYDVLLTSARTIYRDTIQVKSLVKKKEKDSTNNWKKIHLLITIDDFFYRGLLSEAVNKGFNLDALITSE